VTAGATALDQELLDLTRRFHAEVEAGDEAGAAGFVERRAALVAAITASPQPPDAATVEALIAAERDLLTLVARRQHEIVQALAGIAVGRRTLRTYLDRTPASPAYVERLG
jgi:hypothetical protein